MSFVLLKVFSPEMTIGEGRVSAVRYDIWETEENSLFFPTESVSNNRVEIFRF